MLCQLTASEARRQIAEGVITSQQLVQACLDRIAETDGDIQAWEYLDTNGALEQAAEMDDLRRRGRALGALHGVPVGIKDIIQTADMPTQDGYRGHEGRRTGRDALCGSQLRDAGAVTTNWISIGSELIDDWQTDAGQAVMQIYGRHMNGPNSSPYGASQNDATIGTPEASDG